MILKTNLINQIVSTLSQGGVVVMPTDTVYGIVSRAEDNAAVERIYKVKKRNKEKKLITLISDWEQTKKFGTDSSKFTIPEYDEPTTIILNDKAFRLPKDPELRALIRETGPLVAPSANLEGQTPARNVTEARNYFGNQVDLYVDGGEIEGRASKIIRLSNAGDVTIIRE